MLLTISNSELVSTGCLLLIVYLQQHITSMTMDSTCSYIHLKVNESSHKDQGIAKFKERFYDTKGNLQSKETKIKVKEQEQQMYVSQRLKTYEHVGKAYNHRRLRSDERQTMKDEKSAIKDHKA